MSSTSRVRTTIDLFALLLLGAVQQQFGVTIIPWKSATGFTPLSGIAELRS